MTQWFHFWEFSKETQNTNMKGSMYLYVNCSVIYNSQDLGAAQVSISRWIDETTMGHLHNGIVLAIKKKKNLPFAKSMDGPENIMLSE